MSGIQFVTDSLILLTESLPRLGGSFASPTGSPPHPTGYFAFPTGSLPHLTGTSASSTGSLPLLTGSLPLLVASLTAGILLGALFFGGLWWTARRGLTAANPALWFGLSALARMALVLAVFYYIARAGWPSLLACLCGMLIARLAVTHLTRTAG